MHSLRRAALRSALGPCSRAAASVPRIASPSIASRCTAKPTALQMASIPAVRHFSTSRALANSVDGEGRGIEDAIVTAESAEASGLRVSEGETPFGVFVRNMVFDATEEHLAEAFGKHGTVSKAVVARDSRGLSKGYGFVYFTDEEGVKAAIESDGSFWHGRRIQVAPRQKGSPSYGEGSKPLRDPTNCLYIGNIPYETTDAELNKLFRSLGSVVDVRIAVDRSTGWPRGFAHADFTDVEAAKSAMQKLVGMELLGRKLRLDYAASNPRTNARRAFTSSDKE